MACGTTGMPQASSSARLAASSRAPAKRGRFRPCAARRRSAGVADRPARARKSRWPSAPRDGDERVQRAVEHGDAGLGQLAARARRGGPGCSSWRRRRACRSVERPCQRRLGEPVDRDSSRREYRRRTGRALRRRPRPARRSRSSNCGTKSAPVPQASSGLSASRPGSSRAGDALRRLGPIAANGTPARSARSIIISRSPPESWIETSDLRRRAPAG